MKVEKQCCVGVFMSLLLLLFIYLDKGLLHCCPKKEMELQVTRCLWGKCAFVEVRQAADPLQQCGCHHHTPTPGSSGQAVWWGGGGNRASRVEKCGVGTVGCSRLLHQHMCTDAHKLAESPRRADRSVHPAHMGDLEPQLDVRMNNNTAWLAWQWWVPYSSLINIKQ